MAILTDKDSIIVLSLNDLIHVVDVSDTASSPQGTSKKMTLQQVKTLVGGGVVVETDPVFSASPAANVIDSGGGTDFLADDGTYKTVSSGNIYTIDGALLANRTVSMSGFELFFNGGNLRLQGQISVDIPSTHIPTGTTQAIDWNSGNIQTIDLESATGDVTLSFSNAKAGAVYTIKIIQGSIPRGLIYPASFKWEGGFALTSPTEINNAIDLITVVFDGTNFLASYGTNFS
jgi:hypothetical protein